MKKYSFSFIEKIHQQKIFLKVIASRGFFEHQENTESFEINHQKVICKNRFAKLKIKPRHSKRYLKFLNLSKKKKDGHRPNGHI